MEYAALSTVANEDATESEPTSKSVPGKQQADHWKFSVGVCVTHTNRPLPSLVMWRTKAGANEIYGVRSFMAEDSVRDRLMMGDSLRRAVAGSSDCDECLLAATGMCPGLLDGA